MKSFLCFLGSLFFVAIAFFSGKTNAFSQSRWKHSISSQSRSSLKMMFNFGKKDAAPAASKGKSFVITVDGKAITCGDDKNGEKVMNLRKILIANKVDVYPLKAKLTGNCGGASICGTCAVKVISGMENLNAPSKNEQNTLRGKPADFRLSCSSRVSGPITIKTKP